MPKGDIVLISFPFTDFSGSKLRPAVLLAETGDDVTVCFITTQIKWQEQTDLELVASSNNGLKKDSLIRVRKIATIDKRLSKGLLGSLSQSELAELNKRLKIIFELNG